MRTVLERHASDQRRDKPPGSIKRRHTLSTANAVISRLAHKLRPFPLPDLRARRGTEMAELDKWAAGSSCELLGLYVTAQ